MKTIFSSKIQRGNMIRVIAPSQSFGIISEENRQIAKQRFEQKMGLRVSFGKHIEEMDEFKSSSIESRVEDLHDAFADPDVAMVMTVIGGFNCNQLLRYLDFDLIRKNPKIFIGYSDTTALQNAFFTQAGLVTYSGPAYSTFSQEKYFDYTWEFFKAALFSDEPYDMTPSKQWSDDLWYLDQNDRTLYDNEGWGVINEGEARGEIVGGNLDTFNLLKGSEYSPEFKDTILFLEDDEETRDVIFDRHLQSLIHRPDFKEVKGIVIGRFQRSSDISREKLQKIIQSKKELAHIPIITQVDIGHTSPLATFPIGGVGYIKADTFHPRISIEKH